MKKQKIALNKKLFLAKDTITLLQKEQIAGGNGSRRNPCMATQEKDCRTLGLAIDLTDCCPVYELSVNLPCNG
jgi:hypothetical protein